MGGLLHSLVQHAQAVAAQINPLDNGRTYNTVMTKGAQYAPNAPSSVVQQATHNGLTNAAGQVAQNFTNVPMAAINMGKGMIDQFAGDNQTAALNAYKQSLNDAHNNVVTGLAHQLAGLGQAGGDLFGKELAGTVTGNQVASNNANTAFVRDINKTPIGQVLTPIQHVLANAQVKRDLPQISQAQQKQVVARNLSNVNVDPKATLGGQLGTAGLAAGQLIVPEKLVNGVPIATDLAAKGAKVADTAQAAKTALQDNKVPLNDFGAVGKDVPKNAGKQQLPDTTTPPAGQNLRGLSKNVQTRDEFSPELQQASKDSPVSTYSPFTNKVATMATEDFMKQPIKTAQDQVMQSLAFNGRGNRAVQSFTGEFGKQEVSNAGAVMKALDAKGDINGATTIHDLLAQKLTNAGQTGQAAALIYNRTPEGMKFMAQRHINDALGPDFLASHPEVVKQLNDGIDAIKKAPDGSREQDIAKAKFQQMAGSHLPTSPGTKGVSLYKTGILSAPMTAVKVGVVNPITNVLEQIKDIPGAGVDRAVSAVTGKRTLVAPNAGNIAAGARALPTALQDAKLRFKDNIVMPGSSGMGGTAELSGDAKRASGSNFGITKTGERSKLDQATGGLSSKGLNLYTSAVGRVHGALQTPGYEARAAQSLMQQAQAEAINRGLSGADKDNFIRQFVTNPAKSAVDKAQKDAQYSSSQQTTRLGQAASGLQHTLPGGQIIAPITRIPGAVATQVVNYSPAGFLKTAGQSIIDSRGAKGFDQREFSQGMGRAITGTGIMAGGAALMAQGRMSGAFPSDKGTQALWQQANIPENSVYVGGHAYPNEPWRNTGGKWVQVGSPGGPGAQAALTGGQALEGFKKGGVAGLAGQGFAGGAKIATDQPYLTGISGLMSAINTPDQAQSFYDQTAGSVIPNFIRGAATATDPDQRQTSVQSPLTSMKNSITNGIPGLREKNQPQLNVYGGVLPRNNNPVDTYLDPFKPQGSNPSPLLQQLGALHNQQDVNGKSLTIPTQIPKKYPITLDSGKKVPLTDPQRTQFIQSTGKASQAELNQLIKSPDYLSAGADQKSKMISDVVSGQRNLGKAAIPESTTKLTSQGKAAQEGRLPVLGANGKATTSANGVVPTLDPTDKQILTSFAKMSTDQKNKTFSTQNNAQYKYDLASFNNKTAGGKLTAAQKISGQQTLAKEKVGANYSQDVRQIYGLSKAEISDYLDSLSPDDANKMYAQLQSYDGALVAAKLISKGKLANGLASGSSSGGSSSTSKSVTDTNDFISKELAGVTSLSKKAASSKVGKVTLSSKMKSGSGMSLKNFAVKSTKATASNSSQKKVLQASAPTQTIPFVKTKKGALA